MRFVVETRHGTSLHHPAPCSPARGAAESKLKRVHKIERGVVVFLEDSGGDFLFGGANRDEGMAEAE